MARHNPFMDVPDSDDTAPLLALVRRQGMVSSAQLQAALGVSQPTVSRLLARAGAEVLTVGRGKRTRYALPQGLLGAPAQQALHWVHADGRIELPSGVYMLRITLKNTSYRKLIVKY